MRRGVQPCCRAQPSHGGGTFAAGGSPAEQPQPWLRSIWLLPQPKLSQLHCGQVWSRPFSPKLGFPNRKMSNGVSIKAIFIPPDRTGVHCFAQGRHQGSIFLSPAKANPIFCSGEPRSVQERDVRRVPRCPCSWSPFIPTAGKTQPKMLTENPPCAFSSTNKALLYETPPSFRVRLCLITSQSLNFWR